MLGVRKVCPGSSRVEDATRGASEAAREPEEARTASEASVEAAEVVEDAVEAEGAEEEMEATRGKVGALLLCS